jgi:hypothetical protein
MDLQQMFQDYGDFFLDVDNQIRVAICVAVITVWIWSGCFASSVAETRMHGPLKHFIAGLVIPILYPLIILVALPYRTVKETVAAATNEERIERVDGPPPAEMLPVASIGEDGSVGLIDPDMLDATVTFGESYFKHRAVDSTGRALGPYVITVGGDELRAERIVEVLRNAVVIEIAITGGEGQTLRIPYDKIDNCVEVHD